MSDSARVFFGLAPDDALRDALTQCVTGLANALVDEPIRWTPSDAFHMTLRFVGSVDRSTLVDLGGAVRACVRTLAPGPIAARSIAAFPSRSRPRVVIAEFVRTDALMALARAIDEAVVRQGFAPEPRPFRPHMTLGRVRRRARTRAPIPATPLAGSFAPRAVCLYESELRPSGARYRVLERWPLDP